MLAAIAVHSVAASPGEPSREGAPAREALRLFASEYSPRVELLHDDVVVFDASGLERLFGGARALAAQVHGAASRRGWTCGVVVAPTRTTAALLARAHVGAAIVPAGREAMALAALPVSRLAWIDEDVPVSGGGVPQRGRGAATPGRNYRLAPPPAVEPHAAGEPEAAVPAASREVLDLLQTLSRWGVDTLGELAVLPRDELHGRLGAMGVRWQRLARGEDLRPLVNVLPDEPFAEHLALEWPIEGLEPLSFVLARLLDPLCAHLERRDRGAVGLRLWLKLVTRTVFTRFIPLPVPLRDPKVLRTLLTLDLESHPPSAGIDEVTLACDVAPGRIVQHSLLARPLPSPDRVSTLVARLTALMGEGRCGQPVLLDTHRPGAFGMQPFAPEADAEPRDGARVRGRVAGQRPPQRAGATVLAAGDLDRREDRAANAEVPAGRSRREVPAPRVADAGEAHELQGEPAAMLRRFRWPVPAQVTVRDGRPVRVTTRHAGVRGGDVRQAAGPWRTSGEWWEAPGVPVAMGATPGARAASRRAPWSHDEWDVALEDRVIYRLREDRVTRTWLVDGYWD